jgi:hypothetical protein
MTAGTAGTAVYSSRIHDSRPLVRSFKSKCFSRGIHVTPVTIHVVIHRDYTSTLDISVRHRVTGNGNEGNVRWGVGSGEWGKWRDEEGHSKYTNI